MLSGRDQNVDDVTTSFQSDAEKLEGLPVADFMDREKVTKSKSQIGFIKFVLLPLFEALGRLYPSVVVSCISDATQTVPVFSMVLYMLFWCWWFFRMLLWFLCEVRTSITWTWRVKRSDWRRKKTEKSKSWRHHLWCQQLALITPTELTDTRQTSVVQLRWRQLHFSGTSSQDEETSVSEDRLTSLETPSCDTKVTLLSRNDEVCDRNSFNLAKRLRSLVSWWRCFEWRGYLTEEGLCLAILKHQVMNDERRFRTAVIYVHTFRSLPK